jgi:hypothetical protein
MGAAPLAGRAPVWRSVPMKAPRAREVKGGGRARSGRWRRRGRQREWPPRPLASGRRGPGPVLPGLKGGFSRPGSMLSYAGTYRSREYRNDDGESADRPKWPIRTFMTAQKKPTAPSARGLAKEGQRVVGDRAEAEDAGALPLEPDRGGDLPRWVRRKAPGPKASGWRSAGVSLASTSRGRGPRRCAGRRAGPRRRGTRWWVPASASPQAGTAAATSSRGTKRRSSSGDIQAAPAPRSPRCAGGRGRARPVTAGRRRGGVVARSPRIAIIASGLRQDHVSHGSFPCRRFTHSAAPPPCRRAPGPRCAAGTDEAPRLETCTTCRHPLRPLATRAMAMPRSKVGEW